MSMPFALPDWLPWWVPLAVLVPVLLYLAVFLVMPFSVFGLKGRLDLIEARLDEIQGEIRSLALRLRAAPEQVAYRDEVEDRPPIPPAPPPASAPPRRPSLSAPQDEEAWEEDEREDARRRGRGPGERSEPRLDWPR